MQNNELSELLRKMAQFINLAIGELEAKKDSLATLKKEAAVENRRKEQFQASLVKAARALYDADFITDEMERREFLKKASENPSFLSSVIVKVCGAADVALIGSPAGVAFKHQKQGEEFDPVKARAFGYDYTGQSQLLEDI